MCVVFVLLGIEGVFQEFFRDSVISGGGAEDPFPLVIRVKSAPSPQLVGRRCSGWVFISHMPPL